MIHKRYDQGERLDVAGLNEITVLIDRSLTARTEVGLNSWVPGQDGPPHTHEAKEQIFFVTAGTGTVRIGAETFRVQPRDFIYVPAGMEHQTIAAGPGPLQYLLFNAFLGEAVEPYHHWAIRGPARDAERFPLHRIGLATWCDDLAAERARKVRILNGCHTALAAVAGDDTPLVRQAVDHPQYGPWLCRLVQEDILPGLAADGCGDASTLGAFADAVFDRLRNPCLNHRLADIRLNSLAKWRTRLLPTHLAADRRLIVSVSEDLPNRGLDTTVPLAEEVAACRL